MFLEAKATKNVDIARTDKQTVGNHQRLFCVQLSVPHRAIVQII